MNNLLIVERKDLVSDKVLIVNVELVKPTRAGNLQKSVADC